MEVPENLWAAPPGLVIVEMGAGEDRVVLLPGALAYVPSARPLLEDLVGIVRLAQHRYRADAELTLSRNDLRGLGLDEHRTNLLSLVLLRGVPFLGGGSLDPAKWELQIRGDGLRPFLAVESVDDYMRAYAKLLLARPSPALPARGTAPNGTAGASRQRALGVVSVPVAALGLAAVAVLPVDKWVGVAVVFGLAASPVLWPTRIATWPPVLVGVVYAVAFTALVGLSAHTVEQTVGSHRDQPEHYIVHIGEAQVRYTMLRPDGAWSGRAPLVNGEDVFVLCHTRDPIGRLWDQLDDGTFVPDRYLVEPPGEPTPPDC